MKWAHIINISILFDCPPNKSHCSNKHRALLRCLPLPGFELLTLQLTIYYRHLSQVTDKHCDGCMILLYQKSFISLLQATISSGLMSCAYSLLWLSLPFLHPSNGNHSEPHPPKKPFHQEQMYSIIYWFRYLCTLWLLAFFPVYVLVFMCALVSPCIEGVDTDELTSICACGGVQAEQKTASCPWCCFHIVFLCSGCNIQLFRKHSYQSSQLLLANFKARLTCCSFSFY